MLTPQEVSERTFARVMRGYNMQEVDTFLDELTKDFVALFNENAALKAKLKVLVEKVEEYRETEDSMRATLLSAQKMATNLVEEAQRRRADMVASAENETKRKLADLEKRIIQEESRLDEVKAETADFLLRIRSICEQHLLFLDSVPDLEAREYDDDAADLFRQVQSIGDSILMEEQGIAVETPVQAAPDVSEEEAANSAEDSLKTESVTDSIADDGAEETGESEKPKPGSSVPPLEELKFGRNYRME